MSSITKLRLERQLGKPLFTKVGRRLVLTEAGRQAYRMAGEIFALGDDLVEAVRGQGDRPRRLEVGIVDVMPKLVARRLLQPALATGEPVHLVCREGSLDRLLADLAHGTLDVVLAERLALRRSLDGWFERVGFRPRIVAEFEDVALMQAFGADGVGVFPAPDAAGADLVTRSGLERLGSAEGVVEQYHAITAERRVLNPVVRALSGGGSILG